MKISIDHVTNSSSESFGTALIDTLGALVIGIPFIASTLGGTGSGETSDDSNQIIPGEFDPYPSNDPADPPGTTIQNNPDGTKTKTLPDGTVGTKTTDGTIYVTCPDGTTGVITPDGHETYNSPDGTVTDVYTDGTTHAVGPDGSTRTEYPDGTIKATTPDGGAVRQNPDGSFELKEAGKTTTEICDKDGNVTGIRDENGGVINKDKEGNLSGTTITKDGMELDVKGNINGEVTMENPNGTKVVIGKDGELKSGKVVDANGYTEISEDGHITGENTDPVTGVKTEVKTNDEGEIVITDSNGTNVKIGETSIEGTVVSEEGTITIDSKGNIDSKGSDGSSDKVVNNPDGSASWVHTDPNGEETKVDVSKDGNYDIKGPNGEKETLTTNPDGSATLTHVGADGAKTTYVAGADGNINITAPDGGKVTINKDGGMTTTNKEGVTKTFSADEIKDMTAALPEGEAK